LVRMGNERVLRARFNDARFFWDVDQKKKLEERVEDLKHVTFQAKLGSYFEKTERLIPIAAYIAHGLGAKVPATQRATRLCKTDLTTDMVEEFTDLQGIVGAIYDHYRPLNMDGPLPTTLEGLALSIADKIDTLEQCFAIGMAPTGSKDPFALRRAAQGVVRMIVERKLPLPLHHLVKKNTPVEAFLLDRVRYYFKDIRGFQYDEVNAILASGSDDLVDIDSRLTALSAVRPTENFEPLAASFKRIQNILRQANYVAGGTVDPKLLEPGAEADLYVEFTRIRKIVNADRSKHDYKSALEAIASLRPGVDLFFDKVLVNAPDETIRQNRLTLLNSLLTEFSAIADFSEIVTTH
jgi:glycyl-tRNA synthetase beta chain